MLEWYFVRPQTVDRVRASWIGSEIERYVGWLAERGYAARCVHARVPLLVAFGEFARARGARTVEELPAHVEPFVAEWVAAHPCHRRVGARPSAREVRGPIEQMLTVVVPGFVGSGRSHRPEPFVDVLPGFFEYLVAERGLRPASMRSYRHHLRHFEAIWRGSASRARGALAADPERVHRRARRRWAGEDDVARRLRGAARVLALRASRRRGRQRPERGDRVAAGLPAVEHPAVDHLEEVGRCSPGSIAARRRASATTRSCCCWSPTGCAAARSRR